MGLVLSHFCKPGHQRYHDDPAPQSEKAAKEPPKKATDNSNDTFRAFRQKGFLFKYMSEYIMLIGVSLFVRVLLLSGAAPDFPRKHARSLQRRPSLAFDFRTFVFAKDQASSSLDGLLRKTRHRFKITYTLLLVWNY
jgi:hypothetical protein